MYIVMKKKTNKEVSCFPNNPTLKLFINFDHQIYSHAP